MLLRNNCCWCGKERHWIPIVTSPPAEESQSFIHRKNDEVLAITKGILSWSLMGLCRVVCVFGFWFYVYFCFFFVRCLFSNHEFAFLHSLFVLSYKCSAFDWSVRWNSFFFLFSSSTLEVCLFCCVDQLQPASKKKACFFLLCCCRVSLYSPTIITTGSSLTFQACSWHGQRPTKKNAVGSSCTFDTSLHAQRSKNNIESSKICFISTQKDGVSNIRKSC